MSQKCEISPTPIREIEAGSQTQVGSQNEDPSLQLSFSFSQSV